MGLDETLSWPFFDDGHRRFAEALWRAGPMRRCPRCRTTTSTPPAAPASRRWRRPASSRRWCRPSTAVCIRGSTCARSAWRARSWRSATASPISPLPCRAWAPARSRCSARPSSRRAICRRCATAAPSPPSRCRSRRPAPTWRRWRRPRRGRAVACAHRRQQDLDLERRHRRPLRGVRAQRRRPGAKGLSAFVVDADGARPERDATASR